MTTQSVSVLTRRLARVARRVRFFINLTVFDRTSMPARGVRDTKKWAECVEKTKRSFKRWPSAYASYAISSCYKKAGGTYSGRRDASRGVARWKREEWIEVEPYVSTGKRVACGSPRSRGKACRPLKRVSSKTPMTVDEAIRKHGRETVSKLARQKRTNMDGRVNWRRASFRSRRSRGGRRRNS